MGDVSRNLPIIELTWVNPPVFELTRVNPTRILVGVLMQKCELIALQGLFKNKKVTHLTQETSHRLVAYFTVAEETSHRLVAYFTVAEETSHRLVAYFTVAEETSHGLVAYFTIAEG